MQKKTPEELREHLIDVLMNRIVPALRYEFNGYVFPFHFVKLDSSAVHTMVCDKPTETDRFGRILNDMLKDRFGPRSQRALVNELRNVFWWPAVERVWPLQCFEVNTETPGLNDLYLLARTSPDEWIGVQTKRCYNED